MTRKDYILIADTLKLIYLQGKHEEYVTGFSDAVHAVTVALKSDNSRFDCNKFVNYILEDN